jgi:plastocyanin
VDAPPVVGKSRFVTNITCFGKRRVKDGSKPGLGGHLKEERMSVSKYLRSFAVGSVAVLILGAAAACGGSGSEANPTAAPEFRTEGSTGSPAAGESGEAIKVSMTDNVFTPKALTIPVGKSVDIVVKNDGLAIHNLHILSASKEGKDFSSAATVSPGAENKFTVKFTKPGTYNFQCDYHLPDMVGTITVQ